MKQIVLTLDFDGVICNSIDECFITSYNTFYRSNLKIISEFPNNIRKYYYQNRRYVRPAGEFYLIYKAYENGLLELNVPTFNLLKDENRKEIISYEKNFFACRDLLKRNKSEWLSMHKMYDHVKTFLEEYNGKVFIVTTKDRESIEMLSEHFGFRNQVWDIFTKEISTNKAELFSILFSKYINELKGKHLAYVDDNEWNLAEVQHFPMSLYFAGWGYSGTQDHQSFKSISNLREIDEIYQVLT